MMSDTNSTKGNSVEIGASEALVKHTQEFAKQSKKVIETVFRILRMCFHI